MFDMERVFEDAKNGVLPALKLLGDLYLDGSEENEVGADLEKALHENGKGTSLRNTINELAKELEMLNENASIVCLTYYGAEKVITGYNVMGVAKAALEGDVFLTVTGDKHVVDVPHILTMKDGAFLGNVGHFDWEVNVGDLKAHTTEIRQIRPSLEEYVLDNGKSVYVIAEGRLVNLVAAEGHPASVMDMSFANQALGIEFLVKNHGKLENKLYTLPHEVDVKIAELKLQSMGIEIDTLTPAQEEYLNSWKID